MILDRQSIFSLLQAVTAAAGSTDVLDIGLALRHIGTGENLYIGTAVVVAMTDVGSDSDVDVDLRQDDNEGMASPTVLQRLYNLPALSAAGFVRFARLAVDQVTEQFIDVLYTPNNGNLTTGTFTTFVAHGIDAFTAYADNITISAP